MASSFLKKFARNNHVTNATFGILDYLAYPLGMLLVAPLALRALGVAHYGVWAVATAVVSTGSIIASGFGDANIRLIAIRRAGDPALLAHTVRGTMGIHLLLGSLTMLTAMALSPVAAAHIALSDPALRVQCTWSLIIASFVVLLRALETVCVSTQRGFERYGEAVRISLVARIVTLLAAGLLPLAGFGVIHVMVVTACATALGLQLQIAGLKTLLGVESLSPSFDGDTTKALLGFGVFTWIQAVGGLLFGQADRLITGVSLGAVAVASYALCVQLAQPIYGVTASGLHFIFPHLTVRRKDGSAAGLRRSILYAICANVVMVAIGAEFLLLFGARILRLLGGDAVASVGNAVLAQITWSTALSALSITGSYALLALDHVRAVTWLNLLAGGLMLLLIHLLLPKHGIGGIAMARLAYGPVMLLVYIPLAAALFRKTVSEPEASAQTTKWKEA